MQKESEIPFIGHSYECPYCKTPTLTQGACPVCEREQVREHESKGKQIRFHKPFGYALLVIGIVMAIVSYLYSKEPFTILGFKAGAASVCLWSILGLWSILVEEKAWWTYKC